MRAPMGYERELDAVQRWVDEADRVALDHFRVGVPVELKDDATPVTEADRAIEDALRRAIEAEFPGDAILGEEQGASGSGGRRWIVDPIDGTKNYVRGIPVFATLIALEDDGALALGMVSAPALQARWWATRGGGAFGNGECIRVSEVADVADADVISGGVNWGSARDTQGLLALCARARRQRGFGDFWGHMLVAQGSAEIMVELAPLEAWDLAAPRAIVEEAGGRVTGLDGKSEALSGACISTNGFVHDQVAALLRDMG
jgi:histidinol-phosphatase